MKTPSQSPPGWDLRRKGFRPPSRALPILSTLAVLALAMPADASLLPSGEYGTGDVSKGAFRTELFRGAAVPFELSVIPTPNNCEGSMDFEISWDEEANEVTMHLTGEGVMEQSPSIERTLGVDYFPNPFFPEPEDYDNGRYQMWVIGAGGPPVMFLYDPFTLDLIGSEYDFEVPPPAIPVFFPSLYMFSGPMFQPDANGDVDETWSFDYDGMTRGDLPQYSHHVVSIPPPNLCGANPFRLDLSTLRLYVSDPLPASEARPWSDYLRDGMFFDITVEPGEYYQDPPRTTGVATYSGATGIPGGIPRDWQFNFDAGFMGVAPAIQPWHGAGTCEMVFEPMHTKGLNFCGGAP